MCRLHPLGPGVRLRACAACAPARLQTPLASAVLFYKALNETELAALAQVAMHRREHVIVLRAERKGLVAHTMFYVNEVRGAEEYATDTAGVVGKELDLAKKYIEAFDPVET
jgi:non-homologous end joining protein Ku